MKHKYTGKLPEQPWDEEKIKSKINDTRGRMKMMTQLIQDCINQTAKLRQERLELQMKISDAQIYVNQLEEQLKIYNNGR